MNTKEDDKEQQEYINKWGREHPIDWTRIGLFILIVSGFLWGVLSVLIWGKI